MEMLPAVEDAAIPETNVPENVLDTPFVLEGVLTETEAPVTDIPENSSDSQILAEPVIQDLVRTDDEAAGKVSDMIITEKPEEDSIKAEVMVPKVPKEDPAVAENAGKGSSASEIVTEDIPVTETVTDNPPVSDPVIPVPPSDDLPVPEPIAPEPIIPEPGTDASDVTDNITSDAGEDSGDAEETVSCFLLDEAGMLYGFLPEYAEIPDGCLTLPEECTGIRSGVFSGCGAEIYELYIPAGVTMIEEGAFAGLNLLEWIDVMPGNPAYTTESGVLFDSTMSVLLAFPSGWTPGYSVPASVTRIAGRAFENTSISLLDIRACGSLSFDANAFGAAGPGGITIMTPSDNSRTDEENLEG